jgi:hypothetical protein
MRGFHCGNSVHAYNMNFEQVHPLYYIHIRLPYPLFKQCLVAFIVRLAMGIFNYEGWKFHT